MQVPPDLASRLKNLAATHGRSPEAYLREAISRMIDEASTLPIPRTHPAIDALEETPHLRNAFVPQPLSVSVYE